MSAGPAIVVVGLEDTLRELGQIDPKLAREFTRTIRDALKPVASAAAGKAPSRTGAMKSGYGVKSSPRRAHGLGGARIVNSTRQGAILEFAGSASRGKTKQGRSLIAGLDARYGKPGRFAWAAWDAAAPSVLPQVEMAVRRAEQLVNESMR